MMLLLAVLLNLILNFDNLLMMMMMKGFRDLDFFLTWKTFAMMMMMICDNFLMAFLAFSRANCYYVDNYWRPTSWNGLTKLQMRI